MNDIICIGAGLNDPELITVKGLKELKNADIIILPDEQCDYLIEYYKPKGKHIRLHWDKFDELLKIVLENRDKKIVKLYTGDPSLFSSMFDFINNLRILNIPFKIIPGVTSAFYAASLLKLEYTTASYWSENSRSLLLTTAFRNPKFKEHIQGSPSVILYMNEDMEYICSSLSDVYGEETECIVVHEKEYNKIKIKELKEYDIMKYGYNNMIIISHSFKVKEKMIRNKKIVKGVKDYYA